jgi:hypothetical protein
LKEISPSFGIDIFFGVYISFFFSSLFSSGSFIGISFSLLSLIKSFSFFSSIGLCSFSFGFNSVFEITSSFGFSLVSGFFKSIIFG